jgi:3-deoxy-D-manno-octulosonate 8-phosphate phosphatase KdsC-like HAD superfamily phosphatase
VEVDTGTGAIVKETQLTDASLGNANPGLTDLEAMGNFIFALSPGNATTATAVTVMDISGGKGTAKQIQNFVVNGLSDAAAGMAVF